MKIYVVSLPESIERRESIKGQLLRQKLDFEFFDAINGKKLSPQEIEKLCDKDALEKYSFWLNRGQIGCALSHKILYDKIAESGEPLAMIIEDDMLLPEGLGLLLDEIERQIMPGEVILLYYRSFNFCCFSNAFPRKVSNGQIVLPVTPDDIPITTGAYVISREACESLRRIILPIRVGADSWKFFQEHDGFKYISCVYPRPFIDANFKSTIEYDEAVKIPFLTKIVRWVDKYKIPGAYQYLGWRRAGIREEMSRFRLVSSESFQLIQTVKAPELLTHD